jgi:hypothetical protein
VGERKAAGGVPASTGIATATPPGALKRFGPTAEPVSKGCAGPAKPVAMLWWLMSTGERAGNWVNWAHLVVRLGRPTSCAGGEARETPKPNERVYRQETKRNVANLER